MRYQNNTESKLPRLTLTVEDLEHLVKTILTGKTGSLDFNTLKNQFANLVVTNKVGFNSEHNTTYQAILDEADVSRLREVVWDFIIFRYLTIGSYGRDVWPALTITARGEAYFNNLDAH